MGVHLSGEVPADPSQPQGLLEMIRDGIAGVGGIGEVLAGVVTGIVGGLVGAVQGIAGLIGGLFSLGRADTALVDQARVDGENAIVANMHESLEHLDEVQRVGGAFSEYPVWRINFGESNPHPLPLNSPFPLAQGTAWHPETRPLENFGGSWAGNDSNRGYLARGSGTTELLEPGLWLIYFQAALLQGNQYTNTPADVWCYVTPHRDSIPVGAPSGTTMDAYSRNTGQKFDYVVSNIERYGRAGQFLGIRDTGQGGGNTVSGYMMAPLSSPGWFVHMACSGYEHFGGASSTFLFAQKVNSETLRDSIDELKDTIADSLPGQHVETTLNEDVIAAMVAEADKIDVLNEEPGDE